MNNKIRNEYPYPIAKVYLRAINAEEPIEKFTMIGYLFEITLKYAASISISEYLSIMEKDDIVNKILSGITKPSLGKWAEFLRETVKYNLKQNKSIFNDNYLKRNADFKKMVNAVNKMGEQLNPEKPTIITTVSPEFFTNSFIQYRNKTKGHGAIQKIDCQKINDMLLEGLEEYILSFDIFNNFIPCYVSKIELDKYGKYNLSYQKLSGTDPMRSSYSTLSVDNSIRVGNICLCQQTDEGLKPILSLHPLFVFIEDKEEVYVLNEGEMSRIEYLCYHKGGKDAIYSPDELREDFNIRFGDIISFDNFKKKKQSFLSETSTMSNSSEYEKNQDKNKKGLPLLPVFGISGLFIIILIVVYFIFMNKSDQSKDDPAIPVSIATQQHNPDTSKMVQNYGKDKDVTNKSNASTESIQKKPETDKLPSEKTRTELIPDVYLTDPDVVAIATGRAEDYLDYTNLKMSSNFKGNVKIKAYINENGKADKAETIGSGIDPRFNTAAENAVKKLNFSPALKNGKKVKSILVMNISFQAVK